MFINLLSGADAHDRGTDIGFMAGLAEVLDRLCASPLQRPKPSSKQIISEAYGNNFGLQRPVHGLSSRHEAMALMDQPNQNRAQRLSQVWADCSINQRSLTRAEHEPPTDGFMRDCYCSRCPEETKEQPRGWPTPRPDWGGTTEGNSERRWLEQVEQVARRLTIPLRQNWDRGQKLPLPLIASVEPVLAMSQSRAMATVAELTPACTPFGVNIEGVTLVKDGVTKGAQSSGNLMLHGLDHISQVEESRKDTDVLQGHCNMATDNLGWISAGLESFGSLEDSPGNKRGGLHTCHTHSTPFDPFCH